MFKFLLTFLLFVASIANAQLENFSEKNIGSTGDFTSQPISLQSELSHSQTIYYAEDLEFKGEINEIRFRSAFYQSKSENSGNWVVRIGHTTKEEFNIGDPFIEAQTLTEVFDAGVDIDGYDVILRFSTPFIYDGIQNLILDVQDTDGGYTTSATAGFRGEENFNNPPTRSKMTFTNNGSTTGVYENSFANTRFIGNLERCPISFSINKDIIEENRAFFTINNPNNINKFRYKIGLWGATEPANYQTTENDFSISNLIPGKDYVLYYKSDCDVIPSSYRKLYFNTPPLTISVPTLIDFETEKNNFYIDNNTAGFIKVSNDAGLDNSLKGLLLNGSSNFSVYNWWDNSSNLWRDNSDFISNLLFLIDLTENPVNPIFEFSLQQSIYQSVLRLKIDGQIQEFEYDNSDIASETTRIISVDLSDFNGKKIELIIEHLGRNHLNTSFIDNVQLKESTCAVPDNINFTTTQNSITLNWDSDATNWEIAMAVYDETFSNKGEIINTKTHTFSGLEKAKPYTFFLRSKCDNSNSNWLKLYKSTKSTVLEVPYENDFRKSDALNNSDFTINYSRYAKIYQDFFKYLYLDQKSSQKSYGWDGGLNTTENQAWNDNNNFISSVSFFIDATTLDDLTAEIRFKQHYYYNSNTSWFRIKVNGEQIGSSYNPNSVRFDPYTNLSLDLTNYVGNILEITLEQCGFNGPTNSNSTANAGDFTILSTVNFSSKTLNTNNYSLPKNSIYPNPVKNKLKLNVSKEIDAVFVYDTNGKLLFSQKLNSIDLDVSQLKSGFYFLKVLLKNKTVLNSKFIKN